LQIGDAETSIAGGADYSICLLECETRYSMAGYEMSLDSVLPHGTAGSVRQANWLGGPSAMRVSTGRGYVRRQQQQLITLRIKEILRHKP